MTKARSREVAQTIDVFLHPADLARAIGVSQETLSKWAASGHFPVPVEIGRERTSGRAGRIAWLKSEVDAWIRERADARQVASPLAAFDGAGQSV